MSRILDDDIVEVTVIDEEIIDGEVIDNSSTYNNYGNNNSNYNNHNFYQTDNADNIVSDKNSTITVLLCWFGGIFGLHRLYLGRFISGIIYLLTGGLFGIGIFFDLFSISLGSLRDGKGKYVITSKVARSISRVWLIFIVISFVFSLFTGAINIIFNLISVALGFILAIFGL